MSSRLAGAEKVLTVDLHTGHGPRGEVTLLSDASPGEPQDRYLRSWFPTARVEATTDNPEATTGTKSGRIANGDRAAPSSGRRAWRPSLEVGTSSDEEQLVATYQEQWVHRRGDRSDAAGRAAVWAFRCCFTPDDGEWERVALERGGRQLDDAVAAVVDWNEGGDAT